MFFMFRVWNFSCCLFLVTFSTVSFGITYYGQMIKICSHFYHLNLTPRADYTNSIRIQIYLSSGHNTKFIYLFKSLINGVYIYEMLWAFQVKIFLYETRVLLNMLWCYHSVLCAYVQMFNNFSLRANTHHTLTK